MSSIRLMLEVISIEFRKAFSYRSDFWINFFFGTMARIGMAYFLWNSIYTFTGTNEIAGLTLSQMMLYSILAFLVDQVVRTALKIGVISKEIYDGSLTRYLLYPMSLVRYKYSICLSASMVGAVQLLIGLAFYLIIMGRPPSPAFELSPTILGFVSLLPALTSFFLIAFAIDMTAFWADNVWSLMVMLRFISAFLGGAFLPIELFPLHIQELFHLLPFYHIIGVPVLTFMGRLSTSQVLESFLISSMWIIGLYVVARLIWSRGIRKFSGVGI